MRFLGFFASLLLFVAALSFYVHRRAALAFGLSRRARIALAGLLAFGAVAMLVGRLLRGLLPEGVVRAVTAMGWIIGLAVVISAVLLAVTDLVQGVAKLAGRVMRPRSLSAPAPPAFAETTPSAVGEPPAAAAQAPTLEAPVAEAPTAPAPSPSATLDPPPRRVFLAQAAAGTAFLIGGGSSIYGALVGRHDYVIEEVPIRVPGLPKSLDGFTIAQLSDIHFGLFVGEPELHAAEDLVRKARPDLVVLTGDLIDFDPRYADLLGRLARRLGPLAREGVVACPGNHDYFTGIDTTIAALKGGGAEVLRNTGRVIGGAGGAFALLGVDDVWAARNKIPGGGPDVRRAIATVPRDLPRVLLCHNPVYFPDAAGEVALQLSGHTHGGQVNVFVRPADLVLPHGYVAGLYQRGDATLYINRGFGTAGPPSRIGAPPEVSRIVLVAA